MSLPHPKRGRWLRLSLLLFAVILISGLGYYQYLTASKNSSSAELKTFTVQAGEGGAIISQNLEREKLIKSVVAFQLYVWRAGISSQLKPGQYSFAQNLSIREIADRLWRGPGKEREITLTFIEGWNLKQYADYLETQAVVRADDFLTAVQKKADWWDEYAVLASRPKTVDLEGYLFPDTYRVYRDATAEDIIRRMLHNLEQKLTPELLTEIERQGKTIHEVLTLASIVEREVSTDADRKLAADIFYKRIAAGIPLQSDATVNYVSGKGTTRPSADDLALDSLYNTYRYQGLPPGPISNPSLSAITAVIYPTPNPYYYFLTTPDGAVVYSKTHDEHVAAKAQYYP